MRHGLILLLPLTCVIGCSSGDTDSTPDAPKKLTAEESVRAVMDGVRDGKPVVAWESLPDSYQTDVNDVVRSFAGAMDPNLWKQVTELLGSVHQLLVDKNEFILNHPAIAESEDPDKAKQSISQVTNLLKSVLDGTSDLEALKQFDGGEFMTTTGADLFGQLDAISRLVPRGEGDSQTPVGLAALDEVKVETVSTDDATTTLKITQPDGTAETQVFTKVEGKWIPKEMADSWKSQITDAKASIAKLKDEIPQMQMAVMMVGGAVKGALVPLQNASSQEDFNAAVEELKATAMGLVMGGGGGIGGPPAGFDSPFGPGDSDGGTSESLNNPNADFPEPGNTPDPDATPDPDPTPDNAPDKSE